MGQALYRTHRPKRLAEVVGQEHVTKTLEQALKSGRISHAYLLTGPRGVGKTSVARILAHEINGLPYTDDTPHIDIIEIDAASNRRIDEIRDLRDKVYVAPALAKYKVYIIDEVHMLTREAFNALLKTLEEPPAHVVFILATTDAHKLPETIISRTQRFSFKPVPQRQVATHLADIAKQEGIKVTPEALELLADHGEGSFRDSISLLDQAGAADREVTVDEIRALLGIPPAEAVTSLLEAVAHAAPTADIMQQLAALYDQGYQAGAIASQLAAQLRRSLAGDSPIELGQDETLELLTALIEVPAAHDPERYLEICLLRHGSVDTPAANSPHPTAKSAADQVDAPEPDASIQAPHKAAQEQEASEDLDEAPAAPATKTIEGGSVPADLWPQLLQALKQQHNTLYGVVRMAQPVFNEDGLQLNFAFPFHQKRINEAANRQIIVDIIRRLTGRDVKVECVLNKDAKPLTAIDPKAKSAPPADWAAISNIFGGGELLES